MSNSGNPTGQAPLLYDADSGAILGWVDRHGREQLLTDTPAAPSIAAVLAAVGLFASIATTAWGAETVPNSIQIAGYTQLGVGNGAWFRLPNRGPGAYVAKRYRTMDLDGNWWALPRHQETTVLQCGAKGDCKLIGGVKTGAGSGSTQFVGSGVTGGIPAGTDDTAAFADFFDGYLKVRFLPPRSYYGGDVRVPSYTSIRGVAPGAYVGNAQGVGYDPLVGADDYTEKGIPYLYVKAGCQAFFNVANNTAADQAAGIDPITYGYGIDMSGIAIDAWTDNTSSTDARSCISAGSTRMRLSNMHLIRGTYGVGGAATGGSIYTHTLEMKQVTVGTCWRGIGNCIDTFIDAQIANCYTTGLFGTNGSNAVTFTGRIEFTQAGRNIELQSCADCSFDNALCDRAWLAGARLTNCTRVVFGDTWIWKRNGRGQVGVDDDECNLFRQGCTNCDDNGTHGRGADDFNGTMTAGHFSPKHCATYNQVNTNCADKGNHANGYANFYPVTETGTAQGGSLTTMTLAAGASGESGYYNDDIITITAGTGSGQTATVIGYSGGSKIATVASWSGGIAPDNTSQYSIPTGAPSLGTTGPILYMSGRNKTQMSGHLVEAVGSERCDLGRTLQEISGRRIYDNPFSAVLAAAGGTGNVSCTVLGPATTFAIQSMKLRIVARDSNSPSTSYTGECMVRVREEAAGAVTVETGSFINGSEIGASGYVGFGSGVFTTGTCQAGSTATTVVLAAGASSTNDGFVGATITTTGGTGSGQTNVCNGYNGTSKTMSLKRPWAVIPDATTTYSISFGSTIQLGISSAAVTPHPTDPTMQIATFTLAVTNRHAANSVRVFTEFVQ